ncbi:hypothetical protein HDU79_006612 [Rhizoclosmatium sp. JEL0117]|nr:hypothetical protein HDU79_006612 [Rhizoclosmatium sp. JEL0117]
MGYDEKGGDQGKVVVVHTQPGSKLHRNMRARHLEMIAIGGSIGTGLLKKSGGAVYNAGPVGALLCFAIVGLQVFGVITGLGEMATLLPVDGAFSHLPARFVNEALGFASGWNYWLTWALCTPAELSAIASFMTFWTTNVQGWVWSAVYLAPLVLVNFGGVRHFAEVEYTLSLIKVVVISLFILVGTLVWFGVGGGGFLGFKNWAPAFVGATPLDQFTNMSTGGFVTAFFSYAGTELIGVTSGEVANPRKSVPRAIKGTFVRIIVFYIISIFLVGLLLPPDSKILNPSNPISQSPFVYVYNVIGIRFAADVMNAVIIVAALSASNSALYACSRTLMRLADEGNAPKFFNYVSKNGVPVYALGLTVLFAIISVIGGYAVGSGQIFNFLSNMAGLGILIAWNIISITHLRFRRGYLAQGKKLEDLPYVAPFFPYADYLSLVIGFALGAFILFGTFYNVTNFNLDWWMNNSWIYSGVPLIFILYIGRAAYEGHKSGKGLLHGFKLKAFEDMDFETGKFVETEADLAENAELEGKPKTTKEWIQRITYKLF